MAAFKIYLIFWLCVSFSFFQLIYVPVTAEAGVTAKKPQMISTPEEDIPVVEETRLSPKGGGKWLWALLGVAVIGGVAAAAAAGGGGGDGEPSTATYSFSW